ncbi:MAG: glutaredoxin [Moraxellaceae bacterium]|nr:MAG: glutaredoxin [Moraxellaceae bacterium]
MPRYILDESKIHPRIQSTVENSFREVVEEVISMVEKEPVVVIGMAGNPNCKRACKILDKQKKAYRYVEYGSYLKEWRKRNALKMWTGWKTFPMVFIDGILIGGAEDLKKWGQGE